MPLFDFQCKSCANVFEELMSQADASPPCPKCGQKTFLCMSAPSPTKTGAFPYKVGKPMPQMPKRSNGCPGSNGMT